MIEATDVIAVQGETESGHEFGYIRAGSGGFFFTWKYDADRRQFQQVRQVLSTIEPDETDPPTGRGGLLRQAERALKSYINQNGLRRTPASAR